MYIYACASGEVDKVRFGLCAHVGGRTGRQTDRRFQPVQYYRERESELEFSMRAGVVYSEVRE